LSERGGPHHVSATRSTKVDVSTASKGAASERGPSPDGVGRSPYRGKTPRIVNAARTSRCPRQKRSWRLSSPRARAFRAAQGRERRQGCQRLDRAARAGAEYAPRARKPGPPKRILRRETQGSPALPHRVAPSRSVLSCERELVGDRRVPPLRASTRRKPRRRSWEHTRRECSPLIGLGGRSRSNASRSHARLESQDERRSRDLARRNPGLSANDAALGGRASENGAE